MNTAGGNPHHTPYHPKWYRRRMPIFWWLGHRAYTTFIVRELTSLFVGYFAVLLLVQLWTLRRGPEAYARFLDVLGSPAMIAVHVLAFAAILFHTVTWLGLAPSALVVHFRGRRLSPRLVLAGHYVAWLLVSGFLAWLLLAR